MHRGSKDLLSAKVYGIVSGTGAENLSLRRRIKSDGWHSSP